VASDDTVEKGKWVGFIENDYGFNFRQLAKATSISAHLPPINPVAGPEVRQEYMYKLLRSFR